MVSLTRGRREAMKFAVPAAPRCYVEIMKNRLIRYIYLTVAALCGLTLFSCAEDKFSGQGEDSGEESGTGGTGMVSVALEACRPARSRAGSHDEYPFNFQEEDRINNVRVILYDMDGFARYIRDYDTSQDDQWERKSFPLFQTKPFEVERRKYQVAVLVNYRNEWDFYYDNRNREATDVAYRTRSVGHHVSVLTDTPLDFSRERDNDGENNIDNYRAKTFAMQTLAGVYDTSFGPIDPDYWKDNASFFMSNADGLVIVDPEQVRDMEETAVRNPVKVRVERALAKVVFTMADNLAYPPNIVPVWMMPSAETLSIYHYCEWRMDMMNMQVYPMRKAAAIAPFPSGSGEGESMEVPSTSREDRYAVDPNYSTAKTEDFFRIKDDNDPFYEENHMNGISDVPYIHKEILRGQVSGSGYVDMENDPYLHIEYVPENTMTNSLYNTGQVTNILTVMRLAYIFFYMDDGSYRMRTTQLTTYCSYKDRVYPTNMVYYWLQGMDDGRTYYDYITQEEITAEEFENARLTSQQKYELADFILDDVSGELYGFKFYNNGLNYYRIPIRHFSDSQSPDLNTGYGRYGVVRNNTYVNVLRGINGLGSPTVPDPEKIVEMEKNYLSVSSYVYPWAYFRQETGLGDNSHLNPPS